MLILIFQNINGKIRSIMDFPFTFISQWKPTYFIIITTNRRATLCDPISHRIAFSRLWRSVKRWIKPLTHLPRKVLCPEVSIPQKHPQALVACNGSNLNQIQTLSKEPAGSFMNEVMKPKITDPSPRASPAPCALQRPITGKFFLKVHLKSDSLAYRHHGKQWLKHWAGLSTFGALTI